MKNFKKEEIEKLMNIGNEMFYEFNNGNDNEYPKGERLESRWEECEKGDYDLYDEEDVDLYFEVKNILSDNKVFKFIDEDYNCELSLYVEGEDLVLSWIE